jgi:hypothetical protein
MPNTNNRHHQQTITRSTLPNTSNRQQRGGDCSNEKKRHGGANDFEGTLVREGTASNGDDLDMELKNVSPTQGNSSLRYSISQSSPFDSQCHLEVALAITNLEESTPNVKRMKSDGEERTASINIHQGQEPHHEHEGREPPSESIFSLNCGLAFPFTRELQQNEGKCH